MKPIEQAREAIEQSDMERLEALIESHPDLPHLRSEDNDRTLLHTIADYPGHKPKGVEMASLVIEEGADVNARFQHGQNEAVKETPLHWAASNDDVDLAELLLDEGADIDIDCGVIANGTPIWNAVIFRCVNAARLLIDRGAASNLMTAAGAGRRDMVDRFFDEDGNVTESAGALPCWDEPRPPQTALDSAFGLACRNGHTTIARVLYERGADPGWVNPAGETAFLQAKRGNHKIVIDWMKARGLAPDGA